MRYKIINFYLPVQCSHIDDRLQYFTYENRRIVTKHPGNIYEDEDGYFGWSLPTYVRLGNSEFYRVKSSNNSQMNTLTKLFIKVIPESDPMFNFDILYNLGFHEDFNFDINLPYGDIFRMAYTNNIVGQFLGEKMLRIAK